jgi:hypothetical protein
VRSPVDPARKAMKPLQEIAAPTSGGRGGGVEDVRRSSEQVLWTLHGLWSWG